jgi:hypothetical protein
MVTLLDVQLAARADTLSGEQNEKPFLVCQDCGEYAEIHNQDLCLILDDVCHCHKCGSSRLWWQAQPLSAGVIVRMFQARRYAMTPRSANWENSDLAFLCKD